MKTQRKQKTLKEQHENPNGLHARYSIKKLVPRQTEDFFLGSQIHYEEQPVDEGAEYFILRLDTGGNDIEHIKAGRIGVHAYAEAIKHHLPQLAADLIERYPLLD